MKYDVTAVCLDPDNGEIVAGPRTEEIDTDTNVLFTNCFSPEEVEDTYQSYWNRLNGYTNRYPDGKVVVLTVKTGG